MPAYLIDHPPVKRQFQPRNRRVTGCTVLHTAESLMDTVGPDTGAEAVAEFIRNRSSYGSYHDLVDSDSVIQLVPYEMAAYQDGTGSNPWALSISFALSTADWRRMTPTRRDAFLRQGARAFARQQAWRKANGYPLTQLRYISRAQSNEGASGFIYHGLRDPGRRSDPGVAEPNLFPSREWLVHCAAAIATTPAPTATQEDVLNDEQARQLKFVHDRIAGRDTQRWIKGTSLDDFVVLEQWEEGAWPARSADVGDVIGLLRQIQSGEARTLAEVSSAFHQEADRDAANQAALAAQLGLLGADPEVLAAALRSALGEQLAADVAARLTITSS